MPAKSSKPRTQAMQNAIDKFRLMSHWLVPFHPYVTQGFKFRAAEGTEINVVEGICNSYYSAN